MAERKRYHHGNLRAALLDAAASLIEKSGPHGWTMAEAARMAEVSAAAPYRHFKGRDDLLEALAAQGFSDFADALTRAYEGGKPNAMAAFLRLGSCYLDFARSRPGHYMAMFESGVSIAGSSELSRESARAQGVIVDAARALFAQMPKAQHPPPRMVADHIWAMSHGVVELFSRGSPGARSPASPEELLESGVLIYLKGLGIISDW